MTSDRAPATGVARSAAGYVPRRRGWRYRHPEWSVGVLVLLGWAVLAVLLGDPTGAEPAPDPPGGAAHAVTVPEHSARSAHSGHPAADPGGGRVDTAGVHAAVWVAMVVAMMLPSTVPAVRYVAFSSRLGRRQRSVLLFVAGYLAVWTLAGTGVVALAVVASTAWVGVGTLVVAAGWELTRAKHHALRRCHRTRPIRFSGWAADRSCLAFGARHGRSCLVACFPSMAAVSLLGHPVALLVVVTGVTTAQRLLVRGERLRRPAAAAWLGAAALSATVAATV